MLAPFLAKLWDQGEVVFEAAPQSPAPDREVASQLLAAAFADHGLEIAGPAIAFDSATALAAADFVHLACWFLLHRDSSAEEVRSRLSLPRRPANPAEHLSADLTLRYLPQLQRRARVLAADDILTTLLTQVLRDWPLAGVASDLEEPPTVPVDFSGHRGLELLYAERYARHPRENWRPAGRIAEAIELVSIPGRRKNPA
jgi:hypothetical protein